MRLKLVTARDGVELGRLRGGNGKGWGKERSLLRDLAVEREKERAAEDATKHVVGPFNLDSGTLIYNDLATTLRDTGTT